MPATINEHTQYVDSDGKPLESGKAYFGVQGADPKVSPVDIYAERDFQTLLANPQILDEYGRTTNKVWIKSRYSIAVDDLNDVQQYQELDNGEPESVGTVTLSNVVGATNITATGTPTVTAYVDQEQYRLKTASTNGSPVTLSIDGLPAKFVLYAGNSNLRAGQWIADQNIVLTYNATSDAFIFNEFRVLNQSSLTLGEDIAAGVISAFDFRLQLIPVESDIRLSWTLIAENNNARVNTFKGIADAYHQVVDVDSAASVNASYNSEGKFYAGTQSQGTFGDPVSGALNAIAPSIVLGQSFVANGTAVSTVKVNSVLDTTAGGFHCEIWTDNVGSPGVQVGADSDNQSGTGDITFTFGAPPATTPATKYWVVIERDGGSGSFGVQRVTTNDGESGVSGVPTSIVDSGTDIRYEVSGGGAVSYTLQSNAFTASQQFDNAIIHVEIQENVPITINTDFTAEVSRDGGTTWTQASLAFMRNLSDGTVAYQDVSIDLSGQPAGTDMKYRFQIFNDRDIQTHAAVLQWF